MKRSFSGLLVLILSIVFVGALAGGASASDSDLDPKWAGGGPQRADADNGTTDTGNAVAIAPDGRIVIAGTSCRGTSCLSSYVRLLSNGELDPSFGDAAGRAYGWMHDVRGITVQPTGDVAGVGTKCFEVPSHHCEAAIEFLAHDGMVVNGPSYYTFNNRPIQGLNAIAAQPDGKLVAVGYTCDPTVEGGYYQVCQATVVRFTSNGLLDSTFHGNGKEVLSFGGNSDSATAVAVASDGKILIAGRRCVVLPFFSSHCSFMVTRLTSDGSVDPSFNGNGQNSPDSIYNVEVVGIALLPTLKIEVVSNECDETGVCWVAMHRLNKNGVTTGSGILYPVGARLAASSIAALPNGDAYVGGRLCYTSQPTFCSFAIMRFLGGLTPDPAFKSGSMNGVVTAPAYSASGASALALQWNQQPILAGTQCSYDGHGGWGYCDFAAARFGASLLAKANKGASLLQTAVNTLKGLLP